MILPSKSYMSRITVSVVVPTYNRGAKLVDTVASLIRSKNDTSKLTEIIVIDDGSHDPSSSVIEAPREFIFALYSSGKCRTCGGTQ
jgi:glycosyltransferase involved in cell wall biosynthesis